MFLKIKKKLIFIKFELKIVIYVCIILKFKFKKPLSIRLKQSIIFFLTFQQNK